MDEKVVFRQAAMYELIKLMKHCLNLKDSLSNHGLAGYSLLNGKSFQLPSEAANDRLIGFREMWRAWRRVNAPVAGIRQIGDSPIAVAVGYMESGDDVKKYIEHSHGGEIGLILARFDITNEFKITFLDKFHFLRFAFFIAMRCTVSKSRVNEALLIRGLIINYFIINSLLKRGIQDFYNFVPFEIDSNFQSLALAERNIRVTLIPSSGPLSTWNRIMIADRVVFSTPYHMEEFEIHKETMRVKERLMWAPEKAFSYIDIYKSNRSKGKIRTIGFYSHGSWLRLQLGHVQTELNLHEAEDNCIERLRQFLSRNAQYQLVVFAHPREKKAEFIDATKSHYSTLLAGLNWTFADFNLPSTNQFYAVDVGVATFSTIIYERLYCGYKTLICTEGIKGFPMPNSSLESICFNDQGKLDFLIENAINQSEQEFFTENNILGYRSNEVEWR